MSSPEEKTSVAERLALACVIGVMMFLFSFPVISSVPPKSTTTGEGVVMLVGPALLLLRPPTAVVGLVGSIISAVVDRTRRRKAQADE
ncbi:MAG: hypothetical protein FWG11_02830 [Promicromonosporaceae bacterium]|nr:hypothetical protein [Promicromonosporaceae bacterium]